MTVPCHCAYAAVLGQMEMPRGFRYAAVFEAGKPEHGRFDVFSLAHPSMERAKRAKIFSPFDALKGFGDAIAAEALNSAADRSVTYSEAYDGP